jgi:hypothetical protein
MADIPMPDEIIGQNRRAGAGITFAGTLKGFGTGSTPTRSLLRSSRDGHAILFKKVKRLTVSRSWPCTG